jgi:hypothetical protein
MKTKDRAVVVAQMIANHDPEAMNGFRIGGDIKWMIDAIAEAIEAAEQAQREKDAAIAERWGDPIDSKEYNKACKAIAQAIREGV